MNIHERVAAVIELRKITRSAFAKAINISPASVTQMCSGRINPSDRTISDICREFRISEKWLRTGEGEMEVETTQRDKLNHFFADVLATAPDERSALVAALDDLPPEFWPMAAKMAAEYAANIKELKKED